MLGWVSLIGHERPVNKMAAFSYAKGDHYKDPYTPQRDSWEIQPKLSSFPVNIKFDLTGVTFSQLTVIGVYYKQTKCSHGGIMWVVRCCCGKYELRRNASIRKAVIKAKTGKIFSCATCEQAAYRRRKYQWRKDQNE